MANTTSESTALIVLINGYDDFTQSDAARNESRAKIFQTQFPKVTVEIFDSLSPTSGFFGDDFINRKATAIIHRLQLFAAAESTTDTYSQPIIFVAHNIGATLVKKILLIALEDHRYHWIAFRTIASCFVESPSLSEKNDWEQFLFQILSIDRFSFSNPTNLISLLSKSLAHIEKQFSVVSHAFHIYSKGPFRVVNLGVDNPWNFQNDESKLGDVFLHIRAVLRKKPTCLKSDYQNFMRLISLPDVPINGLNISNAYPQAMNWLDTHPSYKEWRDKPGSSILEITGIPGSGKEYISSYILYLLGMKTPDSQALLLSFGFDRCDVHRNSERRLVFSLIRQLLILKPEFYRRAKALSHESSMSSTHLWSLFRYLLSILKCSRVFILLNEVDQCREPIMSELRQLATAISITVPLKILVTSLQFSEELGDDFSLKLSLKNDDWNKAICSIVEERTSRIIEKRLVWKDRKQAIISKLCDGEFTYFGVMLNLDILEQSKALSTIFALKQQLEEPVLSTKMAFRTLINGLSHSELAKQALNWIYHAVRPLTASELAVALALKANLSDESFVNGFTFDTFADRVSWDIIKDLDSTLGATVKLVNDRVMLVHGEFRDYLKNESGILVKNFNASIIEQCLAYLSLCSKYNAEASLEVDRLEQPCISVAAALLEYASFHWMDHYKLENPTNLNLDQKVSEFFKSEAAKMWSNKCIGAFGWEDDFTTDFLIQATKLQFDHLVQKTLEENTPEVTLDCAGKAAMIAAGAGSAGILGDILRRFKSIALPPLLQAATRGGHKNTISLVISLMDSVTIEALRSDRGDEAPILLAVLNGHTAIVRFLLDQGFSVQAVDRLNNTAVHLASRLGDAETLAVMRELRKDEFDSFMTLYNNDDLCPLQLACCTGSVDTFDLVFNSSPKDQMLQVRRGSKHPWQLAVEYGHCQIAEKLIKSSAGVSINRETFTSFETAVELGHFDVICLLIKEFEKQNHIVDEVIFESTTGVEIWEMPLNGCLKSAIKNGHAEIVQVLIDKTQREEYENQEYMTAAIEAGYLNIAKILSAAGISPVNWSYRYNPLLDIAIRENFVDIVNYLVEEGVTPQYDGWETSIHYAASLGHEYCIREMLYKASIEDVQREDYASRTALEKAAFSGHFYAFKELLTWQDGAALPDQSRPPKMLILAVKSPSTDTKIGFIDFLIDNGWTVNPEDTNNQDIPLHVAINEGYEDVVELLLDRGANPDAFNCFHETSLHVALHLQTGAAKVLEILLKKRANPDIVNGNGLTPLHIAVKSGDNDSIQVLLNADADMHISDPKGQTALHYAAGIQNESIDVIKSLLDHKAEPNMKMSNQPTPLYVAVQSANDGIASYLLDVSKADPNLYGGTLHSPLQAAVSRAASGLVNRLLNAKADPNAKGGSFGSPLHAAIWIGDPEIVKLLLDSKGNSNLEAPPFGTPLHVLASTPRVDTNQFETIATDLHARDAFINARDYNNRTPLMLAISHQPDMNIQVFLDLGADPNASDDTGATTLHYAAQFHSLNLVEKLLETGAKVEVMDKCGRSILQRAVLGRNERTFEHLLKHLPDDQQKIHLEKALSSTLKTDMMSIFEKIINKEGVNLSVPDKSGWTSLDIANCYELSHEVDMLKKMGAIEGVQKEPSELCIYDRDNDVCISEDKMEAWIEGFGNDDILIDVVGGVRANYCIPMGKGIFYFEVEVLECGNASVIAIGLLPESNTLDALVGWKSDSWGYHSDDGSIITEDNIVDTCPRYGKGQTVGVAVDLSKKNAWFTLDGERVGNVFKDVVGQLYPAVSFQHDHVLSTRVRVNFGKGNGPPLKYLPEGGWRNVNDA